jgi:hypothetical protein
MGVQTSLNLRNWSPYCKDVCFKFQAYNQVVYKEYRLHCLEMENHCFKIDLVFLDH